MKRLFYVASVLIATVLTASCEKETQGGEELDISNVAFSVKVSEIGVNSAEISVRHNGPEKMGWYCFLTEETNKSMASLINENVKKLLKEKNETGRVSGIRTTTNRTVTYENLNPETEYRFIVFALSEELEIYGIAKEVKFTTMGYLMTKTDDWTVSYDRRDAGKNEEVYSIEMKNGASRCHICFIPKWMLEYYESSPEIQEEIENYGAIRLLIGENIFLFSVLDYLVFMELYEYWGYYEEDHAYFLQETFDASAECWVPRQESGDYYAVAIGFDDEGNPTFTYSCDLINIEPEEPSDDYSQWIGSWTLTSKNNIKYTLTFEENDPNYSYFVYGWECGEVHEESCSADCTEHMLYTDFTEYKLGIPFYFNALDGEICIMSDIFGGKQTSESSWFYWGMYGFFKNEEALVAILSEGEKIASAALPTDSQTTLNGLESYTYRVDADNNPIEKIDFVYHSLGYVSYDVYEENTNQSYIPQPYNLPLELPASLVKNADAPAPAAAFKMGSRKESVRKEQAMKRFNNSKKADYSRLKIVK